MDSKNPLPQHWYTLFGIIEPISVLSGAIYAIFFQEKYHTELVPTAFAPLIRNPTLAASWPHISMALGQLGSCYILAMLNSIISFRMINRYVKDNVTKEILVKHVMVVLGVADWTHILLTIYLLPVAPPSYVSSLRWSSPSTPSGIEAFLVKLHLLTNPSSWNALLFGNIIITFLLFCARAAWWLGFKRGSPAAEISLSGTPSGAGKGIKSS